MVKIPQERIIFSKKLRSNQTPWELILWDNLRANKFGSKFKRQVVIGIYIVDFANKNKRVVVELDGAGHKMSKEYDFERTKYLSSRGYKVLRFWNSDIQNKLEEVLEKIDRAIFDRAIK